MDKYLDIDRQINCRVYNVENNSKNDEFLN